MRRHAYPNLTAGDLFRFFRIWKSVGLESSIRGTGKIVEDGGYDQLIELNGRFAELVERRQLDI